MNFNLTTPCDDCPFLAKHEHGYALERLEDFAGNGTFPCHKTADYEEGDDEGRGSGYIARESSAACAGMLIFNEKRDAPSQMMQIAERLGLYDRTKLNMEAKVR